MSKASSVSRAFLSNGADRDRILVMHRRRFLQTAVAAAAAAPNLNAQSTAGKPPRLGFDTYSIRAMKWKDMQLLDYAASLKLDAIQLSSLDDYSSLEPDHLRQVKDHAAKLGILIDAGTGCICSLSTAFNKKEGTGSDALLKGLKVSNLVGAKVMRCYMGTRDDRSDPAHLEACMAETIRTFRAAKNQAQDLGVKIAIENHAGDMQAREVRTIIEESGKDFVGSCLDSGNPMWVAEDPNLTMEILGPYVLTMHTRDSIVFEYPMGAAVQWVALGDGVVDFKTFMDNKSRLCPDAPLHLEIITGRPPDLLPYYDPTYWRHFEKTPAKDFVRFIKLARNGHPFMGAMVVEDAGGNRPEEFKAALREQQRIDLERSLEYAKKQLGAGIQWRS